MENAEKKFTKYPAENDGQVASFVEGVAIMLQRFPKEWFLSPSTAIFEGHEMPVPSDWDRYLTISYGDYMKLPPEKDRVYRHDTVFVDLEHGYKRYRGIKYYTQGKEA